MKISPNHMVVGSDYKDKEVIGSRWAKQLHFFDKIDGYSTTKTIQSISSR
jgi:D-beta-D-heptose 7-phosphate kinase/D-beta-D-heptose 1-phosphate adenosyltransferase